MASQQSTQALCSVDSHSPPKPLLSILNVVVDHVMMEPCPLEPEEFGLSQHHEVNGETYAQDGGAIELFSAQDSTTDRPSFADAFPNSSNQSCQNGEITSTRQSNKPSVRVPVLRIFGPVLRNGDDSAYHKCTQDESKNTLRSTMSADDGNGPAKTSYSQQPQSGCLHIHGAYPYMLARPVIAGPDGSMHHGHFYESSQSSSDLFSPVRSSEDSPKRTNIDWDNVDSVSLVLADVHEILEGSLRASMENSPNPLQPRQSAVSSTQYIRSVKVVCGRGFYTYCSGPPAPFLRVEYYDPSMRWRVKLLLERGLELSSAYHPDPRVYDYEFDEDELGIGGTNSDDSRPLKFRCYEAHIPYTMQVFKDYNLAGLKYINVGDVRFRQPLPRSLRKRTKEDFYRQDTTIGDDGVFFLRENVGAELLWPKYEDGNERSQSQQQSNTPVHRQHWLKKQTSCDLEFDTTVENLLDVLDVMTELPSPLEERQKIHWRAVPSLREIWEQERKRMKLLLSPDKDFLSMNEVDVEDGNSSSDSSTDSEEVDFQVDNSIPQFTLNVKKGASVSGTRLAVKGIKQLFRTSEGLEDDFKRALKDILSRHDQFLDEVDQKIANGSSEQNASSLDDGIEALAALGGQFTQLTQASAEDDDKIGFCSQCSERTPDSSNAIDAPAAYSGKYTMTQLTQAEIDEEREMLESSSMPHCDDNDDNHSDDDFLREEEELGEEEFERTLTLLDSQPEESSRDNSDAIEDEDHGHEARYYQSQLFFEDDSDYSAQEENKDEEVVEGQNADSRQFIDTWNADSFIDGEAQNESTGTEYIDLPDELIFQPKASIRQGDILSQTWHPLPNAELNECPPWFGFKCKGSNKSYQVSTGTFLQPVKRAPSYNHVRSWMRANIDAKHLDDSGATQVEFTQFSQLEQTQDEKSDPLSGIRQQGCKVQVSGGGGLKTSIHTPSTFTPMTIMSIEIHVQCRIKESRNQKEMAMVPDSSRDAVYAVVYVFARDPGGGENIEVLERGSVLVSIGSQDHNSSNLSSVPPGIIVEHVKSERGLLLRIASIVKMKDPDILLSWDTQGNGIGYLVERGMALGKSVERSHGESSASQGGIDIARLLGRIPKGSSSSESHKEIEPIQEANLLDDAPNGKDDNHTWTGSGLGSQWDDRVGAGAAAASIAGRIVICGWKICSEECKHPNASYQPAIVASVLNKRIPFHDDLLLTRWYSVDNGLQRRRVIEYRILQAMSNIMLLDELDVLGRAGEAARLSGVEFSQSLPGIRGSQYKVEGVLLRALQSVRSNERGEKKGLNNTRASSWQSTALTATLSDYAESQSPTQSPWKKRRTQKDSSSSGNDLGYFFYSPSKDDCSKQEALECQALTLEPLSGFHFDPVVVCDFTALYPSLVIAYNLCYSTVAGKLDYHSTRKEMRSSGKTTQRVGPFRYSERKTAAVIKHHIKSISYSDSGRKRHDRAFAVPTGSIFVSESVLKGVLPQVLDEMLATRAMLKKAAKEYKKQVPNLSPAILRQIEARQLALKYVANVTYGYTSATFSGRSAAPLVADAIVECGRRTLTNAINLANKWGMKEDGRWRGAQVLYGDTDSVFIKLPGRSVQEAFAFGEEYCKAVTASNPPPVQLKLEKVYAASLLQTKKKYCGMMCEHAAQKRPVFEAKGIETVRRDQCTLTQKILRNALIEVFQWGIAPAKDYLRRQWSLIHAGKAPVSDFVLTGRVRSRYRGGRIGPVQAALARRLGEIDPGRVIRHKERLPYVIVASPGKAFKLRDCVLTPLELLEQWDSYTIHSAYYITKHVNAALQRCFGLPPFNFNVNAWYESCPKPRQKIHYWPLSRSGSSLMISSYFGSDICTICDSKCKSTGSSRVAICPNCKKDEANVACITMQRLNETQEQANRIASICSACNGCLETPDSFATEVFMQTSKKKQSLFAVTASQRKTGRLCNPMANCVCIDCPMTYLRHELREIEIETLELMKAI